jgi:hypothetical protein
MKSPASCCGWLASVVVASVVVLSVVVAWEVVVVA